MTRREVFLLHLISIGPPPFDSSGFGEMQRRILLALDTLGWNITIKPFASLNAPIIDPHNKSKLNKMLNNTSIPFGSPQLFFCPAPMFNPDPHYYNIGFTMTEVDKINNEWVTKCNGMDEVWVPSLFNYQTFLSCGVDMNKLKIMHLGVDTNIFKPSLHSEDEIFTFLSISEFIPRKAFDLLLEAFCEEFTGNEPVRLIVKAYENWGKNSPDNDTLLKLYNSIAKKFPSPPLINLVTEILPYDTLPSIYQKANCYVSVSRGEGWNLPAIEAMSCGIPTIAHNWSGHTEFINDENGFFIDVNELETIPDFCCEGARWIKVNKTLIKNKLRFVYENKPLVKEKGTKAREHIEKHFSIDKIAQRISQELHDKKK